VKVTYELTAMGRGLEPAVTELRMWAQRWLDHRAELSL
jgi:DNA-binding HxlR family transcriptional regulator